MKRSSAALGLTIWLVLAAASPPSGAAASTTPNGVFADLFPNPTGKNGYEELVLAADLVTDQLVTAPSGSGETVRLNLERRVLADRSAAAALALLKRGLEKPVTSPRSKVTVWTAFPELTGFLRLARLVALAEHVELADGRVADAIASMRMGLRLGRVVQTDTLMAGVIGTRIDKLVLKPIGTHLDQLAAHDCKLLFDACTEWLAQPDTTSVILPGERRLESGAVQSMRDTLQKDGFAGVAKLFQLEKDDVSRGSALLASQDTSPAALDVLFRQVEQRMEQHLDRQSSELQKQPWERSFDSADATLDDRTAAGFLTKTITPAFARLDRLYTEEQARIRLLATHSAILRFRWEFSRPPASLEVLNLGDLTMDPFTGKRLAYRVQGVSYHLVSEGYAATPDDAGAVNGRHPVSAVPE